MKVSVIVPLFNKKRYIPRCLDSIAGQTFSDWEALVVDDGSTDGGGDLVETYPDRRFRLIRQPNRGPGAARNRALSEARGEYVAFLDADDKWLPRYLETMVGILDREPLAAAATCGYCEYPKGASREPMWRGRGITEGIQRIDSSWSPLQLHYRLAYMWPCSTIARTETVRHWGGFFEREFSRYGEDAVLWLKVLLHHPVYFLLKPLAIFDRGASELSSNLPQARPFEPFVSAPETVLSSCPAERRELLRGLLALRAYKTAAMLGYWGDWRAAGRVFGRFARRGDWRVHYFWMGLAGCTPLAGWLGSLWRARRRNIDGR